MKKLISSIASIVWLSFCLSCSSGGDSNSVNGSGSGQCGQGEIVDINSLRPGIDEAEYRLIDMLRDPSASIWQEDYSAQSFLSKSSNLSEGDVACDHNKRLQAKAAMVAIGDKETEVKATIIEACYNTDEVVAHCYDMAVRYASSTPDYSNEPDYSPIDMGLAIKQGRPLYMLEYYNSLNKKVYDCYMNACNLPEN